MPSIPIAFIVLTPITSPARLSCRDARAGGLTEPSRVGAAPERQGGSRAAESGKERATLSARLATKSAKVPGLESGASGGSRWELTDGAHP